MNNKWRKKQFTNAHTPILRSPLLTISLVSFLVLILLFCFTSNRYFTFPLPGSQNSLSTLLHPLCSSTSVAATLGEEKFIWYAPHSGFSNQLSEFKNAVLMSTILNRTLIVPPILDHHAVALGSCPKFRVLSPNDLRFAVWNHTIELLHDQRYVSMADIIDLSELMSNSGVKVIDFRVFISLWCGVQIDSLCSRDVGKNSTISESLRQCGSLLSGYTGNVDKCLYASDEDCTTSVWTYQKDEEDGSLDVFQPDEQLKKKKKISFVRRRRDVYQTLGPGSKAESAQVLAFGSLFTAPYKGSESHIDIHVAPKNQRIQSLIERVEYLPLASEIVAAGKKFARQTIHSPFLCAQLRLLDGQFKNHWKTTFQLLKQELESLKQKGQLPIHVFVMTDLPARNWSGSYLEDLAKDSKTSKLFMLREDDHLIEETAKKLVDAGHGINLHSSLKHFDTSMTHCAPRILPDVLLYVEEAVCSCASLGFVGTAGSTIAESITVMRKYHDFLSYSRAFWVSESIIAWNEVVGDGSCYLYASKTAALSTSNGEILGYDVRVKLEGGDIGLPENDKRKFSHIQEYKGYIVPPDCDVTSLLKCQLAVALFNSDGKCLNSTGLQLSGILDDLFFYTGPLGAVFSEKSISLYLWAPTALEVSAHIYVDPSGETPLQVVHLQELNGVWSVEGPRDWEGCYYVYEVSVYHPSTQKIGKCISNDPYARGLSADGRRTLLVNLDSDVLKPEGWDSLADEKPDLVSFSDISIYELHVRDFSANDNTVHPDHQGCYLAFTSQDSAGVKHLKRLSNAGITHVHLLPTFHFAGVDDEKHKWKQADIQKLEALPPDSDEQQALITAIQDEDGYNWGYNPVLFGVPKGSYSSNPNGPSRSMEFRKMVQALNRLGLRVVLDVVYNHLNDSGPYGAGSVLDKIVPGYYLRRDRNGFIEQSTCTNNTASEHLMAERLVLDDLLSWAINYKVDGFRFDLMGHMMKHSMVKAKAILNNLSKDKDGVDGSKIYIYGEGWDFGEVANNGRGINASQFNLCGTGIGNFNDRIRDATLGGSPFGHPLQQGFVTGLSLEPNGHDHGSITDAERMLSIYKDHIQVGMAANLKDIMFTNHDGHKVKGSEVLTYDRRPVGYAFSPNETINYISAHDNETLFDILSLKTPISLMVEERCRINHLATSIVALSQGIPFFHAGDELLRSKSLDRDSYNSGDWFNRLDFSYNSNNWGVGIPPKGKNESNWPLIKPRLADPSFKPQKGDIIGAVENFLTLLRIRYSSPLFRLRTTTHIQERVRFHNTGPACVHGTIVLSIEDGYEGASGLTQLDSIYSYIVVIFNARPNDVSITTQQLQARALELHPVQISSNDEVVKKSEFDVSSGCFKVPGRTVAVFVELRK